MPDERDVPPWIELPYGSEGPEAWDRAPAETSLPISHEERAAREMARAERARKAAPRFEGEQLLEFVKGLVAQGYSALTIARRARIHPARAETIKRELLEAQGRALGRSLTDDEKATIARENVDYFRTVKDDSITAYRHSEREGNPNARQHNPGLIAARNLNRMLGLDAPTRQINLNVSGKTLIHPAHQQAIRDASPDDLDRLLDRNAQRRALSLPDLRDGPGGFHGDGRGGLGDHDGPADPAVDPGPASGGDQQGPDEGADGAHPPADHRGPPEAW